MSVRIDTLPNGITVATDHMPEVKTAALGIWISAGSRYEDKDEHGISHLLEHMAFKGTKKRTARQINEEIESVGGEMNAATGIELTAYYVRLLGEDLPLALDILSDILTEPRFERTELAREQSVIVQEIGGAKDSPDDVVYDLFQKTAFPNQAIGRPILGTPKTVRSFTPGKIRQYMAKRYRGKRMIVAAAGAVDHDKLLRGARKELASVPSGAPEAAIPAKYRGGIEVSARKLEQTHILFGLEGISYNDPDRYAMQVFAALLGGGSSSRLYQEVRERRGLCYSISAFHSSYQDTGVFGVSAGADSADAEELIRVTVNELERAAAKASAAEVARAKAQLKVGMLSSLESVSSRAEQLGGNWIAYGRVVPVEEVVAEIDAIDVERARAAGRRLLENVRPTFAGIGGGRGLERAGRVVQSMRSGA